MVTRYDFGLRVKNAIVREQAAAPIHCFALPNLREDRARDEPIALTGGPEPTVSHNRLVVFPLAGELKVFGCAEDIEALVGPDLAVARDGDGLAGLKESKVAHAFKGTD